MERHGMACRTPLPVRGHDHDGIELAQTLCEDLYAR